MLQVVGDWSPGADSTVSVDGREYPDPSLVEDSYTGVRWLLSSRPDPTMGRWRAAVEHMAIGIVVPQPDGWMFAFAETIIEHGEEVAARLKLADRHWLRNHELVLDAGLIHVGSKPSKRQVVHLHAHSEMCLAPETLVVTADMVWKPVGDVAVGEELVGFDEDLRSPDGERGNSRSKMCRTTVLAAKRVVQDCYRITLEDGTEIISSAKHGWVVTGTTRGSLIEPGGPECGYGMNTRRWVTTDRLATSLPDRWGHTHATKLPKIVRWATPWLNEVDGHLVRDAAWLAGVADGEVQITKVEHLGDREVVALTTSSKTFVAEGFLSHNSPLDGLSTVQEMVDAAVADNQPAIAITDHGMVAGHLELQKVAAKAGIKPIFGIEANLVNDHRIKTPDVSKAYWHFIMLAQNEQGLRNIWGASTESHVKGFYGRSRMDWDMLARHKEGVIASTACLRGPLSDLLIDGNETEAKAMLARMQAIFGERLYLELHTNQLESQRQVNEALVSLGGELGLPLIVVADSHYSCAAHHDAHKVWIAAQTDKTLQDEGDIFSGDEHYHISTVDEIATSLPYLPTAVVDEAIANTLIVAEQCDVTIKQRHATPVFHRKHDDPVAKDKDALLQKCREKWDIKVGWRPNVEEYEERLQREIGILSDKHFDGYMLIVADYIQRSKERGILVGPGRGSAAGCLVAYLLGIVGVDPVEAGLIFERFVNPGRTSLPDIDTDFPSSKRGEVTNDIIMERWGEANVVRIGTEMRLKSKSVVQKVSKVLKGTHPVPDFLELKEISAIIDMAEADSAGLGISWEDLWEQNGDLLDQYRERYPEVFGYCDILVGRLNTYGKHPAGLVISPDDPISEWLPMRLLGDKSEPATQFPADLLEFLGLVKFDILTLRTLDTIQMCLDMIRADPKLAPLAPDFELWRDEFDDPQVWDMLCDGHTRGVFQIETPGGTRMVRDFQPRSISDLCAVITLVRPGPKDSGITDSYLRRRHGKEPVQQMHPLLEPYLRNTLGLIIYQEDVIAAVRALAGYTLEEADEVRSILGKKKIDRVESEGKRFVARCIENGVTEYDAMVIWEKMAQFARYCVTGDTVVHLASSGRYSDGTMTAEEMYRRSNPNLLPPVVGRTKSGNEFSGPCVTCGATEAISWTRGQCNPCSQWLKKFYAPTRGVHSLTVNADDRIRPNRILAVHQTGVQKVWTVALEDGKSITATANHKHLTNSGLRRVDELSVGDLLVVDGGYEPHVYTPSEYLMGDGGFASMHAWTAQAPEHCEDCGHDGSEHRLERAHLDGDRTNNDWSNLRMLCVSCHKRHDYRNNNRRRRWHKGRRIEHSRIVSIEYAGEQMTYSVVVDDPHIWIANGIATANSFNKSHSWSYAVLGYWCAWLKCHFPLQWWVSLLSTLETRDDVSEAAQSARASGIKILPPDINESQSGFSATADGQAVRYGLAAINGISANKAVAIVAGAPYASVDDFLERKPSQINMGDVKTLAYIGAMDSLLDLGQTRPQLEKIIEQIATGKTEACRWKVEGHKGPNGMPCTFVWESEPVVLGKTGKPVKPKPIPTKCTKACRNYTAMSLVSWGRDAEKLSMLDRRSREREVLGIWFSGNPFDNVGEHTWKPDNTGLRLIPGSEWNRMPSPKEGVVPGIVTRVKRRVDKSNREYAFVTVSAYDEDVEFVVFHDLWKTNQNMMTLDAFGICRLMKGERGNQLTLFLPSTIGLDE